MDEGESDTRDVLCTWGGSAGASMSSRLIRLLLYKLNVTKSDEADSVCACSRVHQNWFWGRQECDSFTLRAFASPSHPKLMTLEKLVSLPAGCDRWYKPLIQLICYISSEKDDIKVKMCQTDVQKLVSDHRCAVSFNIQMFLHPSHSSKNCSESFVFRFYFCYICSLSLRIYKYEIIFHLKNSAAVSHFTEVRLCVHRFSTPSLVSCLLDHDWLPNQL